MKKHGIIWWLFIGWWWEPITLPFRILAAFVRWGRKYAAGTEERVQRIVANQKPASANQKPASANQKPASANQKDETHKVAGVSFRQDAIKSLGVKNPDFAKTKQALLAEGLTDEWIYEYEFFPKKVELIPEPDNPYSENGNAIKVVVDGQHIGYIKSGSSAHVRKLLDADQIQQITCFIGGGRSKTVTLDEDGERYILETDEIGFYARLTIAKKTEK